MKWILAILFIVCATLADEPPPAPKGPPERPTRKPRRPNWEGMKKRHEEALKKLKADKPDEYERLMKLKDTDRGKYFHELMKLTRPEGGDHPRHRPRFSGPEAREQFNQRFVAYLKKMDPDRAKEIQELLETNPEKGREAIREILSSFRRKHFSKRGDERISKLLKKYAAADDDEKEKLKAELKALVEESFEKRMQMKERELEHMKKRIEELEQALKKYRESKSSLCEKRINDLLRRATDAKSGKDSKKPAPRDGHPPRRRPPSDGVENDMPK